MRLRSRPRSIRTVLFLLLIIVFLPVVLLQAVIYYRQYQAHVEEEKRASLEVARAFANSLDLFVQDMLTRESVLGLAITANPQYTPAQIAALLSVASQKQPIIKRFNWINPHGRIIASSDPRAMGVDVSFRPHLKAINPQHRTEVSDLFIAVVDSAPIFTISTGIFDDRERLLGVVVGVVDPNHLGKVLAIRRRGSGAVAISDRAGRVVYRYPQLPMSWEQRQMKMSQLLSTTLAGEEKTGQQRGLDGVDRLGSSVPVRSARWALSATRPVKEVLIPMRQHLLDNFLLLIVVIGSTLVVALRLSAYIADPLRQLQSHTAAFARGELEAQVVDGGPREIRELAHDFQRMAEAILRRDREREVFLHTITHDLCNPLAAILIHAEILRSSIKRLDENRLECESLDSIIAETRRVNALLREMLNLAQVDAHECRVEQAALSVILDEFLIRIKPTLNGHQVTLQVEHALPPVRIDVWATERIMQNLLTNAVKFSPAGTPITISAAACGEQVVIAVSDAGPGIPPEELPRIFDRFYRTKDAQNESSLGLGLYIARRLSEAQGGEIWVESTPGRGSVFSFSVPAIIDDPVEV